MPKITRLLLFCCMVSVLKAAPPQVVLKPGQLDGSNVFLRLAGSGDFLSAATEHIGSALAGSANSSKLTVLLENRSDRAIAAFAVLFRVKWSDGRNTMQSMIVTNFNPHQWERRILPGQIAIGSIDSVLGSNPSAESIRLLAGSKSLNLLNNSQHIAVSLDSVIFEDGKFIGADHTRAVAHVQEHIEAFASVTQALTNATPEQDVEDVLKSFSREAGARHHEIIASNIFLLKYRHMGRTKLLSDARKEHEFYAKHATITQ